MPTMDQVVWATVNCYAGGEPASFKRGDLLPEAASPDESAQRQLLRQGGALRIVDVVYTEQELADLARARGEATAARETALDPPAADRDEEKARPVMADPSGAPVVIGDEDLRAEHKKQAAAASHVARKPAGSASSSGSGGSGGSGSGSSGSGGSASSSSPGGSGSAGSSGSSGSSGSGGSAAGKAPGKG